MPLADPYATGLEELTAIERAAYEALTEADSLPFSGVCLATALHGDHQATERALLSLRRRGLVTVNYSTGTASLRRRGVDC